MPRKRKEVRQIGNHTEDQMRAALELIKKGDSIRKAAKTQKISATTLRRYYHKTRDQKQVRLTPNYAVNRIFTEEQENSLKDYLRYCALLFYGLSTKETRIVAYEMALKNDIKIPQSWTQKKMAGKDWLKAFRQRHEDLSLRKPEQCSLARATSFNRANVKTFYDNLEKVMLRDPKLCDATRIFNLDETSTTTVQQPAKVIAPKGHKSLGKVTSGEKGTLVTTCAIISASGQAIPPALIFPRKHFKNHMLKGAPAGSLGLAAPTGWMNAEIFIEVIQHFIKNTNSSLDNPSILIMDNHESHLSIKALDLAKAAGVHIITLHPHTSGKLQPLDVGVFRPFKQYYNAAIESWMLRNPGKPVTIYEVGELVGTAFLKSMTPVNITNAFRKCGIYPFDRDLFTDIDFMPSEVTDRPCTDCESRDESRTQIPIASSNQTTAEEVSGPLPSTSDKAEYSQVSRPSSNQVTAAEDISCPLPSTFNEAGYSQVTRPAAEEMSGPLPSTFDEAIEKNPEINRDELSPSILIEGPLIDDHEISSVTTHDKVTEVTTTEIVENPLGKEILREYNASEIYRSPTTQKVFVSPFQFRDPIKAGPRQNKRKPRKLGRSMVATDTPEKNIIEMEKSAEKKRKTAKKKKVTRKVLQSDTDDEMEDNIKYQESDNDENWLDENEYENPVITEADFKALPRPPKEGEYVLVLFDTKKTRVYYIGKVLETRNKDLEYFVSFLRAKTSQKDRFCLPNVPDLSYVKEHDIKLILPKPIISGSTARQQSIYNFSVDMSQLHVN